MRFTHTFAALSSDGLTTTEIIPAAVFSLVDGNRRQRTRTAKQFDTPNMKIGRNRRHIVVFRTLDEHPPRAIAPFAACRPGAPTLMQLDRHRPDAPRKVASRSALYVTFVRPTFADSPLPPSWSFVNYDGASTLICRRMHAHTRAHLPCRCRRCRVRALARGANRSPRAPVFVRSKTHRSVRLRPPVYEPCEGPA
jgi:hypothetical protein